MYIACIYVYKKKKKKTCHLLPLGSLFLGTELSPSLSLSSSSEQIWERKKGGGGGQRRLTSG